MSLSPRQGSLNPALPSCCVKGQSHQHCRARVPSVTAGTEPCCAPSQEEEAMEH